MRFRKALYPPAPRLAPLPLALVPVLPWPKDFPDVLAVPLFPNDFPFVPEVLSVPRDFPVAGVTPLDPADFVEVEVAPDAAFVFGLLCPAFAEEWPPDDWPPDDWPPDDWPPDDWPLLAECPPDVCDPADFCAVRLFCSGFFWPNAGMDQVIPIAAHRQTPTRAQTTFLIIAILRHSTGVRPVDSVSARSQG